MHSLKNTIVAVGLLGLSFWFYQASTKTGPDLSDQIPPLEVSDGFEASAEFSANGFDGANSGASAKSGFGGTSSVGGFPDFPNDQAKPNQSVADFSASLAKEANDFADAMKHPIQSPPPAGSNVRDQARQSFVPRINSPNPSPSAGSSTRDQGLIDALKSQQTWQNNQGEDGSAKAPLASNGEFQFASQPIPSGDSSYNRLANDS